MGCSAEAARFGLAQKIRIVDFYEASGFGLEAVVMAVTMSRMTHASASLGQAALGSKP
jgi:hypothetical protein